MDETGRFSKAKKLIKEFVADERSETQAPAIGDIGRAVRTGVLGGVTLAGGMVQNAAAAPRKESQALEQMIKQDQMLVKAGEKLSEKALECIALNVYHEARGENSEGKLAVALVTLGRAISGLEKEFGEGVCGVVYHGKQFSWTFDKRILEKGIDDPVAYARIQKELADAVGGQTLDTAVTLLSMRLGLPQDTLFYRKVQPAEMYSDRVNAFFEKLRPVKVIGKHQFFTK